MQKVGKQSSNPIIQFEIMQIKHAWSKDFPISSIEIQIIYSVLKRTDRQNISADFELRFAAKNSLINFSNFFPNSKI